MDGNFSTFIFLGVSLGVYVAACQLLGGVLTKAGWVRREDDPGVFWLGITIPATILVAMTLGGLVWALANVNPHNVR